MVKRMGQGCEGTGESVEGKRRDEKGEEKGVGM